MHWRLASRRGHGPRAGLDHTVDAMLTLSGDPQAGDDRTLWTSKNRDGATGRVEAHFRMGKSGLIPIDEEEKRA